MSSRTAVRLGVTMNSMQLSLNPIEKDIILAAIEVLSETGPITITSSVLHPRNSLSYLIGLESTGTVIYKEDNSFQDWEGGYNFYMVEFREKSRYSIYATSSEHILLLFQGILRAERSQHGS